jgi:hypothetical protein
LDHPYKIRDSGKAEDFSQPMAVWRKKNICEQLNFASFVIGIMDRWDTGILGQYCFALKNIMIHEINQAWIEKANRGKIIFNLYDAYA